MIESNFQLKPYFKKFRSCRRSCGEIQKYGISVSKEVLKEDYSLPIEIYSVDEDAVYFDVSALRKLYKAIGRVLEVGNFFDWEKINKK